jgi:alginate O-acetyltransferase complex protein AlgI
MIFTSLNFLIFFPLIVLLFYLTPMKWRWITLLAASFFFYINIKPVYALLLVGVIGSTYLFTRLIDSTKDDSRKTLYLVANIILVLLPLFFFKYFSVANNVMIQLLENWNLRWPLPEIKYMLPIGISFYTFMAIGYTIDVYNEEMDAELNIGLVALFISFFPLILSGPIERAKNMIPQFRDFLPINYENVTLGLKLMVWGYFMKLVVADRIGIYVDVVYGNISNNNGSSLLIASVLYPFQVYADLGGYSLIAIGTARVMGLNVMQNFNRPFFAVSMAEFWRRWHISLISWLTDYVYTPLSFRFRKYKVWGIVTALMLTFLISGIWHGATFTFIIWGLLQGTFLSIEAFTNKKRTDFERKYNLSNKTMYIFGCLVTTFVLFASSQIFGRAASIDDAFMVYRKIFSELGSPYLDYTTLAYSFIGIAVLMIKDFKDEFYPGRLSFFSNRKAWVRYWTYLSIIFIIILFGVFDGSSFIYFQF